MFTDGPTTPLRVEVLLDVLRTTGPHNTASLDHLLQPGHDKRDATRRTIQAARELRLVSEVDGSLSYAGPDSVETRRAVLGGFDQFVLGSTEVEPYLARYYAYLLGLGGDAETEPTKVQPTTFVAHLSLENHSNPFNPTKQAHLPRWFVWAGLGWNFAGDFICNPYERVDRALPEIFSDQDRLDVEGFAEKLSTVCPELDGGTIYREVWPNWDRAERRFTLGVSHALTDLHVTGRVILHAPPDSRGWSIEAAEPPNDGKMLRGGRVDVVELGGNSE